MEPQNESELRAELAALMARSEELLMELEKGRERIQVTLKELQRLSAKKAELTPDGR